MGLEVAKSQFTAEDFEEFARLLKKETLLLSQWFKQGVFEDRRKSLGLELETVLVDQDFLPAPENESFLKAMNSPLVVPELSSFNTEINAKPFSLKADCFSVLQQNLKVLWDQVQKTCEDLGLHMLMIGTLPTLKHSMLKLENMSKLKRYRALNEQIMRLRGGKEFHLEIQGKESLSLKHRDVMMEAAGTSLQIHLQVPVSQLVRYFNASLIASAATVAVAANSPYLFDKDLWAETRIPIFEQSVHLPGFQDLSGRSINRVGFGSGFLRKSLLECFLENLSDYPVLLPLVSSLPPEAMEHLRLHNGTIWRWNRPILEVPKSGKPHLRIEHRVQAAGPSLVDAVANMAFYVGLVHALARQSAAPRNDFSFEQVRSNFYEASRQGLEAKVVWQGRKSYLLKKLILSQLIPLASQGLKDLQISSGDIDFFIGEVLSNRVKTGQTGAAWQRSFIKKHGPDFQTLTSLYFNYQEQNLPVHEWPL